MTGSSFILDTNILIEIFNGNNRFIDRIRKYNLVYVPLIALGELYAGAYQSNRKEIRLKEIEEIFQWSHTMEIDKQTSECYGQIKAALRKSGKPIPENDVWIAVLAKQHQLPLITSDKHFREVKGIKVRYW